MSYIDGALIELLESHLIKGESGDGGVGVFLFVGHVGDEEGDEFFEFSQVVGDIVFVELCFVVVVHAVGDGEEELGLPEAFHHQSHTVLYQTHLPLN